MLGLILTMAVQAQTGGGGVLTPSLDTLTLSTSTMGTCFTTPLQPAGIRLDWIATNFDSSLQDFKVYRDGVFITSTDSLAYALQIAGLVENDSHHAQDITFNYRVDIVRTSDSAVLASKSVSGTKHYGNCV